MNLPFEYDRVAVGEFGGTTPTTTDFEHARVVILPVPLDRTTSYVPGTRNGPHEILVASSHMELWDEETETDVHSIGIFTLPEMEFPFATMDEVIERDPSGWPPSSSRAASFRSSSAASTRSRAPVVAAVAPKHPGLSVLQIDAHADLRESFMGTPHNHACAMRRVLEHARDDAGRHPQPVAGGSGGGRRRCRPTIFYDFNMRQDANWIDRVVDSLERDGLHHHRLRRARSGDHAGGRHAGAGRAVVVRDARRCSARDRVAQGGRLRPRRAVSDARATSRRTSSARS